jgi:hypothetical protein
LIAACACGRVAYEITGRPIVSLVCFCEDCQAGSKALEALPGAGAIRDADGGTAFVNYRKDRIACTRGDDLLVAHRLRERSATSRVTASCCNAAMVMAFDDARHWTPVFRARLGEGAPALEMRICTKSAPGPLDSDLPNHAGYPLKLLGKLVGARLGMLVGR